jgi:hypothetical protein
MTTTVLIWAVRLSMDGGPAGPHSAASSLDLGNYWFVLLVLIQWVGRLDDRKQAEALLGGDKRLLGDRGVRLLPAWLTSRMSCTRRASPRSTCSRTPGQEHAAHDHAPHQADGGRDEARIDAVRCPESAAQPGGAA